MLSKKKKSLECCKFGYKAADWARKSDITERQKTVVIGKIENERLFIFSFDVPTLT